MTARRPPMLGRPPIHAVYGYVRILGQGGENSIRPPASSSATTGSCIFFTGTVEIGVDFELLSGYKTWDRAAPYLRQITFKLVP